MNRDDLEMLVRAHQAELFRYLRYLGSDRATAEDLVQETFLAAFAAADRPDLSNEKLRSAWLRGIARNVFLNFCRRRKVSPVVVNSDTLEEAEATWSEKFLRGGDGFDFVEALRRCLDILPDRSREVIDMRYSEKRSRAELAELLEMTEDGIKSLLRRTRMILAECISARLRSAQA